MKEIVDLEIIQNLPHGTSILCDESSQEEALLGAENISLPPSEENEQDVSGRNLEGHRSRQSSSSPDLSSSSRGTGRHDFATTVSRDRYRHFLSHLAAKIPRFSVLVSDKIRMAD